MDSKMAFKVPKTGSARDLGEHHGYKLPLTGQLPKSPLWFEAVPLDFAEIMSVNKL